MTPNPGFRVRVSGIALGELQTLTPKAFIQEVDNPSVPMTVDGNLHFEGLGV